MLEQCGPPHRNGKEVLELLEKHNDRSLFDQWFLPGGIRGSMERALYAEFSPYGLPIPVTDTPWAADEAPREEVNFGPIAYEYWYPFGRFLCGTVLGQVPANQAFPLRLNVQLDAGCVVPDYLTNYNGHQGPFAVQRLEVVPDYVSPPIKDMLYTIEKKRMIHKAGEAHDDGDEDDGDDGGDTVQHDTNISVEQITHVHALSGEDVVERIAATLKKPQSMLSVEDVRRVLKQEHGEGPVEWEEKGQWADVKLISPSGNVL